MTTAEQIYLQYHDKVRAYVRGKIQDPHDVEDLVSAVFMKIVQKLDSYDPAKASVSTWVYTITRNTVTDHFRTRRTLVELEDYVVDEQPEELTDDALDSLADALLALKERERDLIVLHYYTGHTLKEVAEMMGMSYINAKVIHKKALESLRAFFAAMGPERSSYAEGITSHCDSGVEPRRNPGILRNAGLYGDGKTRPPRAQG